MHFLGLAQVGSGPAVADADLAALIARLAEVLRYTAPVDGVLLALHGSAMPETRYDIDADFVAAVREIVGLSVPIGVTLDAHANASPRLSELSDIVTVYKTTPHVDQMERGFATARLLAEAIDGRISPAVSIVKVPVLSSVLRQNTDLSLAA